MSVEKNRFEELLGQAIEYALDHGISADYVRSALVDDWNLLMDEKKKRDERILRGAV